MSDAVIMVVREKQHEEGAVQGRGGMREGIFLRAGYGKDEVGHDADFF